MRASIVFLTAFSLLTSACAQTGRVVTPPEDPMVTTARKAGVAAVVLERDAELWLGEGTCTFELKSRVQILADRSKTLVQFSEPIPPECEIVLSEGKVIRPGQTAAELKPARDKKDNDTLVIKVDGPTPNTIVEYRYLVRNTRPIEVFQWFFESSVPSAISTLALTMPDDRKVRYKVSGETGGMRQDPKEFTILRDGQEYITRAWTYSNLGAEDPKREPLSVILLLGGQEDAWLAGNVSDYSSFWGTRSHHSNSSITTISSSAKGTSGAPPPPRRTP